MENTMFHSNKFLTFAFDVEYDDAGNYIAEGTKVEIANMGIKYSDATPVIVKSIKDALTGETIDTGNDVTYFMNCSFVELQN